MSEESTYTPPPEVIKKKKRTKPGGNNPSGKTKRANVTSSGELLTPEVVGKIRRPHPFHMSVDELIEYRASGIKPAIILHEDILFKLGQIGVSLKNAAALCGVSENNLVEHKLYHDAWKLGRAEVSSRIRASLVEDALVNDVLNAKIYLDKTMNGGESSEKIEIEHSIKQNPLQDVPTHALLDVMYKENDPESN